MFNSVTPWQVGEGSEFYMYKANRSYLALWIAMPHGYGLDTGALPAGPYSYRVRCVSSVTTGLEGTLNFYYLLFSHAIDSKMVTITAVLSRHSWSIFTRISYSTVSQDCRGNYKVDPVLFQSPLYIYGVTRRLDPGSPSAKLGVLRVNSQPEI